MHAEVSVRVMQAEFKIKMKQPGENCSMRKEPSFIRVLITCHAFLPEEGLRDYSSVHTTPEISENMNAAFFLLLGLPFTLIRHENGALTKRS